MTADFEWETIDPNNPTGPKVTVIFPGHYTLYLYKHAPVSFLNLQAAKYVLDNPERVFSGVRRLNEGEWWCYTGRPNEWHIREGVVATFPRDKVFAVYLNSRMRVYECRAEYAADDDPLCPVNWQTRYKGLTWKNTSSQT